METQRLFCTFRIAGRLYGVDILDVKEVTAETIFTQVAHAPDEVLGLVNIRGHIYLALDLRRLLAVPASEVTADSRLVLFKPAVGSAFGVVVDEIAEIETVDSSWIEPYSGGDHAATAAGSHRADLTAAVCQLSAELLVVLDPRRFLAVVEENLAATA
jgi:purine-binding chemotaxis protein CheW